MLNRYLDYLPGRLISYYLARAVLQSTVFVLLVVVGLDLFIQCLREFHHIGEHYTLSDAVAYALLRLPGDIYGLFPAVSLLGSLLGLSVVARSNALIAMRVSGASLKDIMIPVLLAAGALLLFMSWVGEGFAPYLNQLAVRNKALALSGGQALPTQEGAWVKSGRDFLHIDVILPHGDLQGISRYHVDNEGNLSYMAYAKQGVLEKNVWIFYNVTYSRLGTTTVSVEHRDREIWPIKLNAKLLALVRVDQAEHTLRELYAAVAYRDRAADNSSANQDHYYFWRYYFWKRLFQPLLSLLMVALATPFMCGSIRAVTTESRIVVGLLLGLGFYVLSQLLAPLGNMYALSPLVAASAPLLLLMALGCSLRLCRAMRLF